MKGQSQEKQRYIKMVAGDRFPLCFQGVSVALVG